MEDEKGRRSKPRRKSKGAPGGGEKGMNSGREEEGD